MRCCITQWLAVRDLAILALLLEYETLLTRVGYVFSVVVAPCGRLRTTVILIPDVSSHD